jgi:hypothetical protein
LGCYWRFNSHFIAPPLKYLSYLEFYHKGFNHFPGGACTHGQVRLHDRFDS